MASLVWQAWQGRCGAVCLARYGRPGWVWRVMVRFGVVRYGSRGMSGFCGVRFGKVWQHVGEWRG